jgi:hypothetical protein
MIKPQEKHLNTLYRWLRFSHHNDLSAVLRKRSIDSVAIYGGRVFGELLYDYLQGTAIEVKYVIDKDPDLKFPFAVEVISPNRIAEVSASLDAIIVTPAQFFHDVKREFSSVAACPIISLRELIVDVDVLENLQRAIEYVEKREAKLFILDYSFPISQIRNPSILEQHIMVYPPSFYKLFSSDIGLKLLSTYYCDLPEFSDGYLREIVGTASDYHGLIQKNDVYYMKDIRSQYYNVADGSRRTDGVPGQYDNTIYFFGNCLVSGIFTEDKYTMPSFLQSMLNTMPLHNKSYLVKNLGIAGGTDDKTNERAIQVLLATEIHQGDIAVLLIANIDAYKNFVDSDAVCFHNIADTTFDRPHDNGEVFIDTYHVNHRGYKMIADKVYSIIQATPLKNPK